DLHAAENVLEHPAQVFLLRAVQPDSGFRRHRAQHAAEAHLPRRHLDGRGRTVLRAHADVAESHVVDHVGQTTGPLVVLVARRHACLRGAVSVSYNGEVAPATPVRQPTGGVPRQGDVMLSVPEVALHREQRLVELGQDIAHAAYLRGRFVLRSGITSNYYFDKYLFETKPNLLRRVASF